MREPAVGGLGSRVQGLGYEGLLVWQKSHAAALSAFRLTEGLPRGQEWLRSQCTRAAVSVPANIAEGYSRGSLKEYLQFLSIARGSLAETEYHLLFMRDAGLLEREACDGLRADLGECARLLLGLIRSLRAKAARGPGEPSRIGDDVAEYTANEDLDPRPQTQDPPSLDP